MDFLGETADGVGRDDPSNMQVCLIDDLAIGEDRQRYGNIRDILRRRVPYSASEYVNGSHVTCYRLCNRFL